MDRRSFLQTAALGRVELLTAPLSAATPSPAPIPRPLPPGGIFPGGNETIKVALVGCGFRGTGAASQVLQTKGPIKLWAMADLFSDRLETSLKHLAQGMEKQYDRDPTAGLSAKIDVPPERRFIGFDAYQKAIDSGVDLVLLTAHQHFRPLHYAYAVKQGKHVFMEKPLGIDLPGIRQLLAGNEEAKRKGLRVPGSYCG